MNPSIPKNMKAIAIDRFGGPELLHACTLPVPQPGADELLLQVDTAGVGVWDPMEREGEFAEGKAHFPYVLGSDGAGVVVAVGKSVKRFKVGDHVYALGLANPKGGFYAEYAAVKEDNASPLPPGLKLSEAGALAVDAVTALRGLEDQLHLRAGESLLIFGASGGLGHLAVQLAKRMGARVLAVASGPDGVELVKRLGADLAIDGRKDDIAQACRGFAPDGIDAALLAANGRGVDEALQCVRQGGRVAHPNGVPPPKGRAGIESKAYDGTADRQILQRLNQLIGQGPFHVELGKVFRLDDAAQAHQQLHEHHLGKLALRVHA